MHARLFVLVLVVAVSGCASSGVIGTDTPSGITTSSTDMEVRTQLPPPAILEFPRVSPDSLWKLVPKAFNALGIKAAVIDQQARVFGNYRIAMSSIGGRSVRGMFRCGNEGAGPSGAAQYRIQFDVAASPRPRTAGGAELIVQTVGLGMAIDASRSGTIQCVSNGSLEQQLKAQIEEIAR